MGKFWLAGGYYIDLDEYEQLRIAGPGNHLFCGMTLPKPFYVSHIHSRRSTLKVRITFAQKRVALHLPIMGDIRSVRAVTEVIGAARPTFEEMHHLYPDTFRPTEVGSFEKATKSISFTRRFGAHQYGFKLIVPPGTQVTQNDGKYILSSTQLLYFTIECFYTYPIQKLPVSKIVSNSLLSNYLPQMPRELQRLVRQSEDEIEHLITYSKTSSFEYGTIFPRDWAESAELGKGDLTQQTIDEMYGQALAFVSGDGEGWHENVIGELAYAYETTGKEMIDRGMIDIEPRYVMGLGTVSRKFLSKHEHLHQMQRVAKYLIHQAQRHDFISFKQRPVGNWRDSPGAFKYAPNPLYPFDVNAVFYPAALSAIYTHRSVLHIPDEDIVPLLSKWFDKKSEYFYVNDDGYSGYALCIYGEDREQLRVHHSDEAYLLLYGNPRESDVVSLAKRLLDMSVFFTQSGPLLVGAGQGYTVKQYHGEVIWPKQTALLVAGLRRQIERARNEGWSEESQFVVRDALISSVQTSLRAFVTLKSIPELYIDRDGTAVAYDTQHEREGQVSYSQLWSAVGFRRMLRDLIYISNLYDVPVSYFGEDA